jgi:hypothetical protein
VSPIGVHVRLGDYKNFPNIYGRFDPNYFERALETMFSLVGERPVWLFSDEPSTLFDIVPKLAVRNQAPAALNQLSGLETLNVMARMQGLVCSNSTFSWWGAFLADRPGFRAIFPSPLFAKSGPADPKNFILPGWLQLGRDFNA